MFDDYDGLSLFVQVVRAGSLAAAARATGIPKATLSRRLTALERTLDVPLVRRTKRGIVPTEQGRRLFDQGGVALALAEQAVADVRPDRAAFSGLVRISLPPDIGVAALAPALIGFRDRHAAVDLDITLDDRRVSLVEEGYDLVVRMGSLTDSDLMSRRIAALPRRLVASPAFLARHPPVLAPDDLGALPALAIGRDIAGWTLRARDCAAERTATVRPRIVFSANRQTIVADAAVAGLGYANLPRFLVDPALSDGRLVPLLPGWDVPPVVMTALWPRNRITTRLVAAIVDSFVRLFERGDPIERG